MTMYSSGLGLLMSACLSVSMPAWTLETARPAGSQAAAARLRSDSIRCTTRADVDACNDAIRRNPSDPVLLIALADALMRVDRPADALRHYRRAAAIAPGTPGLSAKITAADKRLASDRSSLAARYAVRSLPHAPAKPESTRALGSLAAVKHYSNADPETQSH